MDELTTTDRLHPVAFDFWWPQRPEVNWQVVGLRGREQLSAPYELAIELICDDPHIDPDELLGTDAELLLDRNGLTRTFFGVVAEVDLRVATAEEHEIDGIGVRVLLVPAFRMLEHEIDVRFFMGQTVIEILRERLGEALAAWGRELDVESRITGSYNRRDYCVQFRESTFAFCGRIMEEEGIAYVFVPDHEGARETMVLVDQNSGYAEVELLVPGRVPIVPTAGEELDRESIQTLEWRRKQTPNRVISRAYNLKNPGQFDVGQAEREDRGRPVVAEHYLDGDRRQIIDDPLEDPEAQKFTGADLDQRASIAARALERHTLVGARGRGRANAIGFAAGGLFELAEPLEPIGAIGEQQCLIVRVEHHGQVDGDSIAYHNQFAFIPKSQPFRPARRTPKPRVYGVQTGVVVGRQNDEIYTDPLGRIRVRFHRDRSETDGEQASCWIRVAQMWAGNGYGTMIIPRVGMEVVVAFVDGDPDQPLVTGSVYHPGNTPPYPLPAELSKSTIKTRSTAGGDGFNELRIEDQGGREQIFVHAQRRMDVRVRGRLYETSGAREEVIGRSDSPGEHNTLIHGDVNHRVSGDRATWIESTDYSIIDGDRVEEIAYSQYSFVGELSQLNATHVLVEAAERISHKAGEIEIAASRRLSVKGGTTLVLQSNNRLELIVGQSFITLTPTAIEIGSDSVLINSGGGAIERASDGLRATDISNWAPIDALAADDGRPRAGQRGRGAGRKRSRTHRHLIPRHAPPMDPIQPTRPRGADKPDDGRQITQINWAQAEAWCSEPTPLWVHSLGYAGSTAETLIVDNLVDGATACVDVIRPASPVQQVAVTITDVVPRRTSTSVDPDRMLVASLLHAKTPTPIRLRFLTDLPRIRHDQGRARFDLTVSKHAVTIGGTIEYTRGWIFYIIRLDDLVAEGTEGHIGGSYYGSTDWRYCKPNPNDDSESTYVYWNGSAWIDVPAGWTDPIGTRRYGVAVWREGGEVKTQMGSLKWPDPVPDTWTHEWEGLDLVSFHLGQWASTIEEFWTHRFDLERVECRSHEIRCCRYRVRCSVSFEETDRHGRGIIVAENFARANASVWPYDTSDNTLAHEFGHHLGNPDEYPGATSVDPSVHGDGAKAGIDRDSIMGGGELVRRRHFDIVCKAMAESVAQHTGKNYSYEAVLAVGAWR